MCIDDVADSYNMKVNPEKKSCLQKIWASGEKCVLDIRTKCNRSGHHHHHQSLNREGHWGTTEVVNAYEYFGL